MPDLPQPARLSLHDTIGYVAERCECDMIKAGKAVLAALGEEKLVASANVLVSDRGYLPGVYDGPIPAGTPHRVDAGVQLVPSKLWRAIPGRRLSGEPSSRAVTRNTGSGRRTGETLAPCTPILWLLRPMLTDGSA